MTKKCALYDIESDLRESHLIPKFVFEYLKKTGGKYFRTYENPNQRMQDGPKVFLLSEKAEQDFSKRERWFANNVFYPYLGQQKTNLEYDENLAYFVVSVLWRILKDQLTHPEIANDKDLNFLNDVESEWRNFLSNFVYPVNYNDINFFLTDRIESHNTDGFNVNLYFTRIVDATIVSNEKRTHVAVYVKFLRFVLWSVVKGDPNDCQDVKINFLKGNLNTPQELSDDFIGNFFQNRIQEIDNRPRASKEQQEIINQEVLKNEKTFWETEAAQAMLDDYQLKKDI